MIIEPSTDYESCVLASWEAIGPYFHERGMAWDFQDRLELFRQTELFKVKDKIDVGFFMLWIRDEKLFIADIHIYPSERNKGYGKKMLEHIRHMASSRGKYRVWLRVFKNNPAVRLYQRNGFQVEVEEGNGYLMSCETS